MWFPITETLHGRILASELEQLRASLVKRGLIMHDPAVVMVDHNEDGRFGLATKGDGHPTVPKADTHDTLLIAGQVCDWPGCGASVDPENSFTEWVLKN